MTSRYRPPLALPFFCLALLTSSPARLQVHMLTVHHGEPEADNMLEETPSQSEKPLDVVEPPRDLKKCSASNCDKCETDQVKFKLCAPCKDVGKKVPYCSRSVTPRPLLFPQCWVILFSCWLNPSCVWRVADRARLTTGRRAT